MDHIKKYWWAPIAVGFLLFFPKIGFLENVGSVLILLGIVAYFIKRKSEKKIVKRSASASVEIPREIFVAWTNKHPAFSKLVSDAWSEEQPYSGMTDEDILSKKSDKWFFKFPPKYIKGLKFVPDPTNTYNKEAISIVVETYGKIGYVPDADLDAARILMDTGHECTLRIRGGEYKQVFNGEVVCSSNQVNAHILT